MKNPAIYPLRSFSASSTVDLAMFDSLKRSMQTAAGRTAGQWCVVYSAFETQATNLIPGLFPSHSSSRLGKDERGGGTG